MNKLEQAGVSVCAVADAFPMMGGEDWRPFVANIAENGVLNPIVYAVDGALLDGRNRLTAWLELGHTVESCPSVTMPEGTDELAFVAAQNIARRNLTSGQRACVAVLNEEPYKTRAALRQSTLNNVETACVISYTSEPTNEQAKRQAEILLTDFAGKADDELATDYNTNSAYIRRARKLYREDRPLFDLVLNGAKTLQEARAEQAASKDAKVAGKFDALAKAIKDLDTADMVAAIRLMAEAAGIRVEIYEK